MYFHLIIQLNAVGVAMSLDVSKIALVVETVAIPLVPYYKKTFIGYMNHSIAICIGPILYRIVHTTRTI